MSSDRKISPDDSSLLESFRSAARTIGHRFSEGITDVTKLDVTTLIADQVTSDFDKIVEKSLNFKELKGTAFLVGFTRIDADGDIIEVFHGNPETGELSIDPRLLEIHKQNREIGVESWNRFFTNLMTITATIWTLVDPNPDRVKVIEALREKIKPIGKPSSDERS